MNKFRRLLLGKPRNPLSKDTHRSIALVAFLAWIGLGADGLSSANYGPEQAFIALGKYQHLALYLAVATALTVFLISSAYNQVIRLFPNGGGGYKVASRLIGPHAGLISGAALIIDYALTITTSVASSADALFSLLPFEWQHYKLSLEVVILLLLMLMNLRGAKESIKILMPIFLGFFITHVGMIIYGIVLHQHDIPTIVHEAYSETSSSMGSLGAFAVLALFMRAYSLGSGTYTGLEAVSNNVNILKEPRVKTGTWTMFYMALSLSIVAGGIILLYLLWAPVPHYGKTLNAVVFHNILASWPEGLSNLGLVILLLAEAGILLVAANTGFLGGPAVLANMAVDSWVPKRFSMLSSRLVTQNGIILFGLFAAFLLLTTEGDVSFLVVLYSINVFITFSMSLLGLTTYWWRHRQQEKRWLPHIFLSILALVICVLILISTLLTKFESGGWITIVITGAAITIGLKIRGHYRRFNKLKARLNQEMRIPLVGAKTKTIPLDSKKPTGVFLVSEIGAAMHSLLWVNRMFPDYFRNFIFVSHGEVDIGSFGSQEALEKLKRQTDNTLDYLVTYAKQHDIAADSYCTFGTDPVDHIYEVAEKVNAKYTNTIYFASRYVYPGENWFIRILHSDMTTILQRRLQPLGVKMLVLPLKLEG
ncbi:MAG: amino acid transporter [Coxiella sp. RIFCSPHIGHO2_12_FULL_42_15]|nr:MAG: amino acid transporter [Coxiella sp. RIFCSPHIGHO2_12_FULL_42_15]